VEHLGSARAGRRVGCASVYKNAPRCILVSSCIYIYILLYDAFSKEDVRIPKLEFYVALSKKSLGWCIHRAFNVDGGRAGGINRRHASSFS
jgi:hypothetical protein